MYIVYVFMHKYTISIPVYILDKTEGIIIDIHGNMRNDNMELSLAFKSPSN